MHTEQQLRVGGSSTWGRSPMQLLLVALTISIATDMFSIKQSDYVATMTDSCLSIVRYYLFAILVYAHETMAGDPVAALLKCVAGIESLFVQRSIRQRSSSILVVT